MIFNASNPNNATERILSFNPLYIASKQGQYDLNIGSNTLFCVNPTQSTTLSLLQESTHSISIPSSGMNMLISSNSSDDNSTGVGCRSVYLEGLDNNGNKINEIVNTNGVTPVATTSLFSAINRQVANSAGGTVANVGTIFVGSGTVTLGQPANIYSTIIPSKGWSRQGIASLPNNYLPVLMQCTCYAGAGREVEFQVLGKFPNSGWIETFTFGAYQGVSKVEFAIPATYYSRIDIQIKARCLTSGQIVNTFFLAEFTLIKNTFL